MTWVASRWSSLIDPASFSLVVAPDRDTVTWGRTPIEDTVHIEGLFATASSFPFHERPQLRNVEAKFCTYGRLLVKTSPLTRSETNSFFGELTKSFANSITSPRYITVRARILWHKFKNFF